MDNTYEIILKLKDVKQARNLSLNDIVELTKGTVSKSTVQRVFADGSEENSFRYEETLRPIANALLDIDSIEEGDSSQIQAMKSLLKYKMDKIEELEKQIDVLKSELDKEKIKAHEKLESEREHYNERIDFMNHQIELKDKRMDMLLEAVFKKDKAMNELNERLYTCQCCDKRNKHDD